MPASWRERNADRRVEIVGSALPDRLVAAPFTRGFGAHIILDGYRGDDTLVGGSGAAPGGWISLLGSWRGEWGHDQVLLSPAGPSVSPRIRSAGKTLLVDVGPSRRLAGTTLRLDVASCKEWCWDVTTLARGRVTLASGHWTLARHRLTRAGRRIWRARDNNDNGIGFTSRTIRARVWVHDLLE
jgi:hypothetical protein